MKKPLFLTALNWLMLTAQAQWASIKGVVSTEEVPVAFATVALEGTTYGTLSDDKGFFEITNVPHGDYLLRVSATGYRSFRQPIVVASNQSPDIQIKLSEDLLALEEVVVSGTRYEYDRANAPVVVNILDYKILNASQSITISDGLSLQPGVRVETNCQNCGFTEVRLNGLEGAYSQILINSRAVFSALNSVYGLDQIPTNIVEQIEVVRGGGSALYGSSAIAGTINIITKEPVENTWEIGSNTALIDGDAWDQTLKFNGSIVSEDLTSGVTFYGMNRNRDSWDANGDGFTELVELANHVLGAKAFFKPNAQSKLSLDFSTLTEHRRGGDRLDLTPHFTDITEELDHKTFIGGLNYEVRSNNSQDQLTFYASAQGTKRDSYYGGLGGGRTAEDSLLAINAYGFTNDLALVAGTQYNKYLTNEDVITLGIESQNYNTRDQIRGYKRLVDQRVNTIGFFGQYEWKPTARLTTLLGARYDISDVNGTYEIGAMSRSIDHNMGVFSPRVTLLYKINEAIRLRGGYARGFRAPQAFNEDLHISSVGGEAQFVILSDELGKETSDTFTGSLNYAKNLGLAQFNFLIEGFHTQLQNPFTQVSTGAVLPNGSVVEEVRNGEGANVSGINFEVGYSPGRQFIFQLGGTAQQTGYDESQVLFEPEGTPSDGESIVVVDEFVRTPNLYGFFTSNYRLTNAFKIDLTGTYTGPMIVPRVVSESGFPDLIDSGSFFDLNLKATYDFDISDDFHLELSAGAKNLFNSFQPEFEAGPKRDSDFIYGPAAPRSVFISIRMGNLR